MGRSSGVLALPLQGRCRSSTLRVSTMNTMTELNSRIANSVGISYDERKQLLADVEEKIQSYIDDGVSYSEVPIRLRHWVDYLNGV